MTGAIDRASVTDGVVAATNKLFSRGVVCSPFP
jgi:hypothetical protein